MYEEIYKANMCKYCMYWSSDKKSATQLNDGVCRIYKKIVCSNNKCEKFKGGIHHGSSIIHKQAPPLCDM